MRLRQKFFAGGVNGFVFTETISTNLFNYDLVSRALSAGWDGVKPIFANITFSAGGSQISATPFTPAFSTAGSPALSTLSLTIAAGVLVGGGPGVSGPGGAATGVSANNGGMGGAGGTALRITIPTTISNFGTIAGGGGGGGGGGGIFIEKTGFTTAFAPGGAGGIGNGSGGVSGSFSNPVGGHTATSGNGGDGGTYGLPGGSGGNSSGSGGTGGSAGGGAPGGAGGNYIDGAAFATWTNVGTRLGNSI